MPRPEVRMITYTIDGREVTAPENAMLVDAAKYGDGGGSPEGMPPPVIQGGVGA